MKKTAEINRRRRAPSGGTSEGFGRRDTMKPALYFAYGSNLDPAQMRRRCPTSAAAGPASLPGWRLAFGGHSRMWGGSVATLRKAQGESVAGLLYEISAEDLVVLDRYEGHPFAYVRKLLLVTNETGRRRRANVYVLPVAEEGPPAPVYLGVMRRAYRRLGFDCRSLALAMGGVR